jgi:hypothetical protein
LEKAIEERKFYKRTLVDCRLKCRKILQISDFFIPSDMNSSVESLRLDFFEKLVRESQCLKKCKSENLEPHMHDSRVMPSVDEDFDHLKPYSYLQFCTYTSILFSPHHQKLELPPGSSSTGYSTDLDSFRSGLKGIQFPPAFM